jgi:hypothetical protein
MFLWEENISYIGYLFGTISTRNTTYTPNCLLMKTEVACTLLGQPTSSVLFKRREVWFVRSHATTTVDSGINMGILTDLKSKSASLCIKQ